MRIIQTYLNDSGLWFHILWLYWVINENHIGKWMLLKPGYTLAFAFLENSLIVSVFGELNIWAYNIPFYKSTRSKARIAICHPLFLSPQLRKFFGYSECSLIIFQYHSSYYFSVLYHVSLFCSLHALFKSHLYWIC